jgi:hypothetical protein
LTHIYKAKHIYHITMPPPTENNDMSDDECLKAIIDEKLVSMWEEIKYYKSVADPKIKEMITAFQYELYRLYF